MLTKSFKVLLIKNFPTTADFCQQNTAVGYIFIIIIASNQIMYGKYLKK